MRILVIEDERRLAHLIAQVLTQERFDVETAFDGMEGLELALRGSYDALIVDRMLPGRDGVALVRALRAEGIATPVLMLTARGELGDRVEGLDAGADDYLGKPFAFEEVLARLRALLRRTDRPLVGDTIAIGNVRLNQATGTVTCNAKQVQLTRREYVLLETLARHQGQILTRDQLLETVWGYDADPQGNVVELYVHYVRRKLAALGPEAGRLISTVRGAGYVIHKA